MLNKTPLQFNLPKLINAVDLISTAYPFHKTKNQIGLTYNPNLNIDKVYGYSIGSLPKKYQEKDFNVFNDEFKDTYLYTVYNIIKKWSPYTIGRFRIANLPPQHSYSYHQDKEPRYHIAVHTHKKAFILCNSDNTIIDGLNSGFNVFHMPVDGHMYEFDARLWHTAFNGDRKKHRIHILISACL